MAMELRQQVKMTQQLRMTPQLQQAIKLLQLSRMELIAEVRQEMVENPVLEEIPEPYESEGPVEQESQRQEELAEVRADERDMGEVDWEAYAEKFDGSEGPGNHYTGMRGEELPGVEQTLSTSESLVDHLMEQLRLADLAPEDEFVGALLIGNLNEAGFLTSVSLEEIAQEAGTEVDRVEAILALIQTFDPVGVAARDLRECLLIQARLHHPDFKLLHTIIEEHIPDLERKSYGKIARAQHVTQAEVLEAAKVLSTYEPRPGRAYSDVEPRYITPDIYIRKLDGEWVPVLNEDGLPKLRISNFYRQELARKKAEGERDEVKDYIQEKLRGALWLIRSIHQRQNTIVKVTESIIKFQRDFFEKGVEHLKPLVLRDVAEDIGMHESTVSRVTSSKYVHTPRGVFELKYFFNSSITNLGGEDLASEAVKAKIRDIISQEDPRKPLSDARIVALLKEDDVDIARRTVAKYREMMGILSSSKRKQLF
ncbi:RNA polymerase sigma-54 factor [Lujinxingia litoralis]|uniref:RNA polymerase sigma-54 factor n=1 Tax=Lujinxingia litoralis TaxID=2211119 RepID=A0A328C740_9DELT|nr:RNA polymerase factor sigma-54 [Lujinxingia litoralis]RAL22368.1 RNA polymerase sigma-54 factor [Lujinxingia litoralis]